MRTIKFRAWIKYDNIIATVLAIDFKGGEILYDGESGWKLLWNRSDGDLGLFKDIELMQYTGLTDNKNTEIYESDIVKIHHKDVFNGEESIAEVIWYDDFAQFQLSRRIYYSNDKYTWEAEPFMPTDEMNILVLGNTYENPKLMELIIKDKQTT